jgi:hypothetical protein
LGRRSTLSEAFRQYVGEFAGQAGLKFVYPAQLLQAVQWTPSDAVSNDDIISLLNKTFPDLGGPEQIRDRLIPQGHSIVPGAQVNLMKQAAGEIAMALLDLNVRVPDARDPSRLKPLYESALPRIQGALVAAKDPSLSLVDAAAKLITAHSWLDDLREAVEAAIEAQALEFPFTLTQTSIFSQAQLAPSQAFDFSQEQMAPEYVPVSASEEMEISERSSLSTSRDVTGDAGISAVSEDKSGGSGSLRWRFFGMAPPVKYGEAIAVMLRSQRVVVIVQSAQALWGGGGPTGEWLVSWRHPGD